MQTLSEELEERYSEQQSSGKGWLQAGYSKLVHVLSAPLDHKLLLGCGFVGIVLIAFVFAELLGTDRSPWYFSVISGAFYVLSVSTVWFFATPEKEEPEQTKGGRTKASDSLKSVDSIKDVLDVVRLRRDFIEQAPEYPHWSYVHTATTMLMTLYATRPSDEWDFTLESLADVAGNEAERFKSMSVLNGVRVLLEYGQGDMEKRQSGVRLPDVVRTHDVMISELLDRYGTELLRACTFVDKHNEAVAKFYSAKNASGEDGTKKSKGRKKKTAEDHFVEHDDALQYFLADLHHTISVDAFANELPLTVLLKMMGLREDRVSEECGADQQATTLGGSVRYAYGYDGNATMRTVNRNHDEFRRFMNKRGIFNSTI